MVRIVFSLLMVAGLAQAQTSWQPLAATESLELAFTKRVNAPNTYRQLVSEQAWAFPEGDLFPIILPLLAFANGHFDDPSTVPVRREAMAALSQMAIEALEARVGRSIAQIETADGEATYIGQVNLALSTYRLVGGDDRFERQNRRLSELLHKAIAYRHGAPIHSWPDVLWPFDTLVAVLSLRVRDRALGTSEHESVIVTHLEWLDTNGLDPVTGLPASELDPETGEIIAGPRGCDLSFRIALLSLLDRDRAATLYQRYVEHHWRSGAGWVGFTEYPDGNPGPVDADSGPIVAGPGLSATGLGFAATRAVGDEDRWNILRSQANLVIYLVGSGLTDAIAVELPGGLALDSRYTTGFLFGDAALWWAVTFTDWGVGLP